MQVMLLIFSCVSCFSKVHRCSSFDFIDLVFVFLDLVVIEKCESLFPYKDHLICSQMSRVIYKAFAWTAINFLLAKIEPTKSDESTSCPNTGRCYQTQPKCRWCFFFLTSEPPRYYLCKADMAFKAVEMSTFTRHNWTRCQSLGFTSCRGKEKRGKSRFCIDYQKLNDQQRSGAVAIKQTQKIFLTHWLNSRTLCLHTHKVNQL